VTVPTSQAPAPGSMYGLPGLTLYTEQFDNNNGAVQGLSQTNSVTAITLGQFTQTDVVFWWDMELTITNTVTAGTSTVTTSPYFPFSFLGESKLRIQNMYDSWHPLSGVDALIWQLIRPMHGAMDFSNLGAAPINTWQAAALPQANLDTGSNFTSASTSINFTLEIPVSLHFDVYFDLAKDGTIISPPHRAIVSPQYMAGSARVVQPQIGFNAGSAATVDQGPYNIGSGTGTFTGQVAFAFKKVGIYGSNNPGVMPTVYNWQYMREARQFTLAGRAVQDILVPTYGQILSIYVRLFDPSANGGLGAPISVANVTKCQLKFGSGLFRFDDTPRSAQRRIMRQNNILLPQGVLAWDLGLDNYNRVTNAAALNTLTTASVLVHLEFTAAQSNTAYAVLGVEALTYVE
jgi:hypothetical protein